jgi:hypothetical protein
MGWKVRATHTDVVCAPFAYPDPSYRLVSASLSSEQLWVALSRPMAVGEVAAVVLHCETLMNYISVRVGIFGDRDTVLTTGINAA